jgi:hypothetical protein
MENLRKIELPHIPVNRIPDALLVKLLPRVIAWAEVQERQILERGVELSAREIQVARAAGVRQPERVRLLRVADIPLPEEKDLQQVARGFGFISQLTDGLTLGYGVFVRQIRSKDPTLVAHELMHVAQYEHHGSIAAFLLQYLSDLNKYGYDAAPLEREAVAFEKSKLWERRR